MSSEGNDTPGGTESSLVKIRLCGLPIALHKVAIAHYDAVRRELSLMRDEGYGGLPPELSASMEMLQERYKTLLNGVAHLESSLARGGEFLDLHFDMAPGQVSESKHFIEVLDQVDAYCRDGRHLLTLPDPRAALYRRWFVTEIVRQVGGAAPTTWSDSAEAVALAELNGEGSATEGPDLHSDSASPTLSVAHRSPTSVTVRFSGEIDLDQAPTLRRLFADLLADGVKEIAVDGSDVEFIDSVGVSVLMAMFSRCSEAGGFMTVQSPSPSLLATLQLAGVADVLC